MIVAQTYNRKRKIAWETEKDEAPFYCRECSQLVILRKGRINEHHFAHKKDSNCICGVGESQIHLKIKRQIYQTLINKSNCRECELERYMGKVRPDISVIIDNIPVAIEIQKSNINIDDIVKRIEEYTNMGIYMLWILVEPKGFSDSKFHNIKGWEEFLYNMYYGHIFYYFAKDYVESYKCEDVDRWIEESNYYDSDGTEITHGGYYKTYKRLKEYCLTNTTSISSGFKPDIRTFNFNGYKYSNVKIFIEKEKSNNKPVNTI